MKHSKSSTKNGAHNNVSVRLPADYGWQVLSKLVIDLRHLFTEDECRELDGIILSRDFSRYLSLSEAWTLQCTGTVNTSLAVMRAKYQVAALLKKFRFPGDDCARRDKAKSKFLEAEESCAKYNHTDYMNLACIEDERMLRAYTYARSFLRKLLGFALPPNSMLTHWSRHGPGANLDTLQGNTSLYSKYSEWPYSCTEAALDVARLCIEDDERWLGALEDSYRERYGIPKHVILDRELFWSSVFHVVPGNRITFVPKNSQTDRSIAIEPSMNLYLQLGIDGFIRRRLKRWGIDLDSQAKNRELARQGSRDYQKPENFVTLDLAAASDSISTAVCYHLLPLEWYNHLMKLRSPSGVLDDETISYEKISSMGNGFTFALETAIFTAVVYGVSKEFQGLYDPARVAVYGDDIIVPNSIAQSVVQMLNRCGFKLNLEKSFFQGPFRESCGADWFRGSPVRPVFLTHQPRSVMELWTDLNRIQRTLSLRFMVDESNVVSLLDTWVPPIFRKIRGPYSDEQFDSYRHVRFPVNRYENSLYTFKTLVVRSEPQRGALFLFRKLMHDLRGTPVESSAHPSSRDVWLGARLGGSGGRFTITKRSMVVVGYTHSVASNWRSEYAEV